MRATLFHIVGLSCAVLLALEASHPPPAHAAPVFNVKTDGATGNGTNDDTDAILAAAVAAYAQPRSTLLFPQGDYLLHGIVTGRGTEVVGQSAPSLTTTSTGGLELSGNNTKVYDMRFATRVSSANTGLPNRIGS